MAEMKEQIEIGDHVRVSFNNIKMTLSSDAIVLHIPCATGDSWIIRDVASQELNYISEGCTITLIEELRNG